MELLFSSQKPRQDGTCNGSNIWLPIFSLHGASERECNGIEAEATVFVSRTSLGRDM
jgi:hypothetical protein